MKQVEFSVLLKSFGGRQSEYTADITGERERDRDVTYREIWDERKSFAIKKRGERYRRAQCTRTSGQFRRKKKIKVKKWK